MLDFLLDNWFFALIVLWFLFGLFGRGNKEQARREQHKHPAAEKSRREFRKQRETVRTETDHEEAKRKLSNQVKRTARQVQSRVEEAKQAWQEQQEVFAETVKQLHTEQTPPTPYARENETPYERKTEQPYARRIKEPYRINKGTANVMPTDRESLRQGIIWAEVLGKPRAKRPYRSPYLRRD